MPGDVDARPGTRARLPAAHPRRRAERARDDRDADRSPSAAAACSGRGARESATRGVSAHHREGDGTTPSGHVRDRAGRLRARLRIPACTCATTAFAAATGGTRIRARGRTTASATSPAARAPPFRGGSEALWRATRRLSRARSRGVQHRACGARPRLRHLPARRHGPLDERLRLAAARGLGGAPAAAAAGRADLDHCIIFTDTV